MMTRLVLVLFLLIPTQDADRIQEFAKSIDDQGDPVVRHFKKLLSTPTGRIVLNDRAEREAQRLRREAERSAIEDYMAAHFEEGKLKAGRDNLRRDLLNGKKSYDADLADITRVLKDIRERLIEEGEENRTLKAFLGEDYAPIVAYVHLVRPKLRPSPRDLAMKLGGFVLMGDDGRYYVPESKREMFKERVEPMLECLGKLKDLEDIIRELGRELAEPDDFHKRLKKASQDKLFAGVVMHGDFGKNLDPDAFQDKVDNIIDNIEAAFEDTDDGLVLAAEMKKEVEPTLIRYEKATKIVARTRDSMNRVTRNLRMGDDIHTMAKKLLSSDVILARVAEEADVSAESAEKTLRAEFTRIVMKVDGDRLQVTEESKEELRGGLRQMKSERRKQLRRWNKIQTFAETLVDEELKTVYASDYGKLTLEEAARERFESLTHDGLGAWIGKHFEQGKLKAGSEGEIRKFIGEVDRIGKELEDDEFDDK